MGTLANLLNLIGPTEASAEVLPQDPYTSTLFRQLQEDPRYSPVATAAQNSARKVNLRYAPEAANDDLLGKYEPGSKGTPDLIKMIIGASGRIPGRGTSTQTPKEVLAHELVHFLFTNTPFRVKPGELSSEEFMAREVGKYGVRNRPNNEYDAIIRQILQSVQSQR